MTPCWSSDCDGYVPAVSEAERAECSTQRTKRYRLSVPEYERDEFDELAALRGPVGVHRKKPSPWTVWIAALVVIVLAGGLAYGTVVYLWRASGGKGLPPSGPVAAPTITQTRVVMPTDEPVVVSPSATASQTTSPTPTAEPIHYDVSISVLNGAGVSGLAARNLDALTAAGYSQVVAGNLTANKPDQNVVRYADPLYETTANDVAAQLGIDTVERGVTPDGAITVLLVTKNLG